MGGKGTGRKPIFHDKYHVSWRKTQLTYDRAIAKIRKEKKCSYKEAQLILRKRRLEEKIKEFEREKEIGQ